MAFAANYITALPMPKLVTIPGFLYIEGNYQLQDVDLSSLRTIGYNGNLPMSTSNNAYHFGYKDYNVVRIHGNGLLEPPRCKLNSLTTINGDGDSNTEDMYITGNKPDSSGLIGICKHWSVLAKCITNGKGCTLTSSHRCR